MPTHECPPLLTVTLSSVYSQNFEDWKLVVVDASENNYFEEKLNDFFKNNKFFANRTDLLNKTKIIKPSKNKNLPGSMKMEDFKNCVQDDGFCIFLDHDDMLLPHLLKTFPMRLTITQTPKWQQPIIQVFAITMVRFTPTQKPIWEEWKTVELTNCFLATFITSFRKVH